MSVMMSIQTEIVGGPLDGYPMWNYRDRHTKILKREEQFTYKTKAGVTHKYQLVKDKYRHVGVEE